MSRSTSVSCPTSCVWVEKKMSEPEEDIAATGSPFSSSPVYTLSGSRPSEIMLKLPLCHRYSYGAPRYAAHRYEFGFVRDGVLAVQVCLARLRGFAVAVRHRRENTHGDEVDMGAVRGRAWHRTLHFGTRPGRWVSQAATGDLHQILARRIVEVVLVDVGGCVRVAVEQLLACGEEHLRPVGRGALERGCIWRCAARCALRCAFGCRV